MAMDYILDFSLEELKVWMKKKGEKEWEKKTPLKL
jgi:hypothetical protein